MLWQVQQQEEEKYSELTQHSFISLINLQIKHRNISRIGFDPLNLFFKLITYYSKFFRTSKHHNAHNHSDIRYKQFILYKQMDNFFFLLALADIYSEFKSVCMENIMLFQNEVRT